MKVRATSSVIGIIYICFWPRVLLGYINLVEALPVLFPPPMVFQILPTLQQLDPDVVPSTLVYIIVSRVL